MRLVWCGTRDVGLEDVGQCRLVIECFEHALCASAVYITRSYGLNAAFFDS